MFAAFPITGNGTWTLPADLWQQIATVAAQGPDATLATADSYLGYIPVYGAYAAAAQKLLSAVTNEIPTDVHGWGSVSDVVRSRLALEGVSAVRAAGMGQPYPPAQPTWTAAWWQQYIQGVFSAARLVAITKDGTAAGTIPFTEADVMLLAKQKLWPPPPPIVVLAPPPGLSAAQQQIFQAAYQANVDSYNNWAKAAKALLHPAAATPATPVATPPASPPPSSPGGGQTMNPVPSNIPPGVWVRGQQVGPVLVQATQVLTNATSWIDASGTPIPAPGSVWTAPVGPGPAGTASADLYWGQWSGVWYVVAPPGVSPPPPTSQPLQTPNEPPGPNLWTEVGTSPVANSPAGTPAPLSTADSWASASGAPLSPPSQFLAAPGGLFYALYNGAWWQVVATSGPQIRRKVAQHKGLLQQFLGNLLNNFGANFGASAGQNLGNSLFAGGGGAPAAPPQVVYQLVATLGGQSVAVGTAGATYSFQSVDPSVWQQVGQGQPPSAWGLPVAVVGANQAGQPQVMGAGWMTKNLGPNWAAQLSS